MRKLVFVSVGVAIVVEARIFTAMAILAMMVVHPGLSPLAQSFGCETRTLRESGQQVQFLRSAPYIACNSGQHNQMRAAAAPMIAVLATSLPAILKLNRGRFTSVSLDFW